ncbi:unnamed protein product [Polarella glacialis]|uniref:Uncharacterized protein n=1 Tax=Polarella glacialis TaxID=89957 RepID=A0A813LGU1_POLGL|nr:unnamed protein product [Polarella glacialis]
MGAPRGRRRAEELDWGAEVGDEHPLDAHIRAVLEEMRSDRTSAGSEASLRSTQALLAEMPELLALFAQHRWRGDRFTLPPGWGSQLYAVLRHRKKPQAFLVAPALQSADNSGDFSSGSGDAWASALNLQTQTTRQTPYPNKDPPLKLLGSEGEPGGFWGAVGAAAQAGLRKNF